MKKCRKLFVGVATVAFVLTALAKIIGLVTGTVGAFKPDPVLPVVSVHTAVLVAAILELFISGVCCLSRTPIIQLGSICWLSLLFLGYRLGIRLNHANFDCPCLGYVQFGSEITMQHLLHGLSWFLVFTLIGSAGFLSFELMSYRRSHN